MPTNQDPKRVHDGCTTLADGMDGNSDPSLLEPGQSAFYGNISLRSDFANSRPGWFNDLLNFANPSVQANFAGVFQGACFYESLQDETLNSLIVSIGGHLFRIYVAQNFLVTEITPAVPEAITASFVVPAVGSTVVVNVTDSTVFTMGQQLVIDGGSYTVSAITADQLTLTYNGGALNTGWLVPSLTAVLDNTSTPIDVTLNEQVIVGYNVPLVGTNITLQVTSGTGFTGGQGLLIDTGSYTVVSTLPGSITVKYNGGAAHTYVTANTNIFATQIAAEVVGVGGFTVPAVAASVNIPISGPSTDFTAYLNQPIWIDSGSYTITSVASPLVCTYNGGAAHTTVSAGVAIYGAQTTVTLAEVTTQAFTVPPIGTGVTISVTSETVFSPTEQIIIGGEHFTVTSVLAGQKQIKANFTGGTLHVVEGASVLGLTQGPQVGMEVVGSGGFNVPSLGNTVSVPVTNSADFQAGQFLFMDSGIYLVTTLGSGTITVMYAGSAAHSTVAAGVVIYIGVQSQVVSYVTNPPNALMVFMWQAENYVIIVCDNQNTIYFDGSSTFPMNQSKQQLQSSYLGCYAWGRNWLPQVNGHRFIASDLVGDPSGTPSNNFVDAILYMTENNVLNGGGAFSTPANLGIITAMTILAQLDTSLGIGPVLVGTTGSIFSVQAPVDRTTWQNLTYPIQSVALQGAGPTGPRAMLSVNSDAWFRSLDGVRSLVASRRDFQSNRSNTPNSIEMAPVFDNDTQSLLFYASVADFDNRTLTTVNPSLTPYGVTFQGLAVLNRDNISSIKNKNDPPIWEGLWTGLNIFQILSGVVNGEPHGYMFALNASNGIDLWEISPESGNNNYDVYNTDSSSILPVTGIAYIGNLIPTATVQVTMGNTYTITPGPNEAGIVLVNGSQTIVLAIGTPVTITAQGTTLLFQYPNLVPAGQTYGSAFGGLEVVIGGFNPIISYNLLWGATETFCSPPTGGSVGNPGSGKVTLFAGGPGINYFQFRQAVANPAALVSSSIYMAATGMPLTAQIIQGNASGSLTRTPIFGWMDSRAMNCGDGTQLKKLIMGELYIDQIVDNVVVQVFWKPDQYPTWSLWGTLALCANVSQCTFKSSNNAGCVMWQNQFQQYGARITLPRPPELVNYITNQPMDRGYEYQFRFTISGACRIRKFKAHAIEQQDKMEGECATGGTCTTLAGCPGGIIYGYSSYGLPFIIINGQAVPLESNTAQPGYLLWDATQQKYDYVYIANNQIVVQPQT